MKTQLLVLVSVLTAVLAVPAWTQVVQEGNLTDHIDQVIDTMPRTFGGGDYLQPNEASRALWREIIDHILDKEYADAHAKALTKNYQVVLFTDTGSVPSGLHVVLERTSGSTSRYWGTFVFNTAPLRPHLVIESAHPVFDINTGFQGIRIYQFNGARAFFVAGTHRCNGLTFSPCDGTTSVCSGSSEDYRYSDMAHVVKSTFHIATEAMLDHDPDLLVVQPHGFAETAGDPDLIMSNGTRTTPTGYDYVLALRDAFAIVDPTLTSKIGHVDLSWTRLLGTTNTAGRLLNNSPDPCEDAPFAAAGNFIHVEQAVVRLVSTQRNTMKLAEAIAIAIPPGATPVEPGFTSSEPAVRIIGNYANPLQGRTRIEFELKRSGSVDLAVYDLAGRRVAHLTDDAYPIGVHGVDWNAERLSSGVYFLRLRQGAQVDTRRCVFVR